MTRILLIILLFCTQNLLAQSSVMDAFDVGQDPSKISLPEKQGTILSLSSSFDVKGNQGQSKYSYSFGIPNFRDFPLNLELQYSSGHGASIAGYGFELSVPYIQRVLRHGIPNSETALEDSLEGELVEVEDGYLRARIDENHSRYSFHGSGILKELSNGMMLYYGISNEAKEGRGDLDVRWWLEKIVDKFGNYISINYRQEQGLSYPQLVRFVNQNDHELYHVLFDYEARPDHIETFHRGVRQLLDRRLTSVQVYWAGSGQRDRVSRVSLAYDKKHANRSLLKSIERFGRTDGSFYPKVQLNYSEPANLSVEPVIRKIESQKFEGGIPSFRFRDYRLIDMNADGLIDLIAKDARGQGNWTTWLNQGDGSFVAQDSGRVLDGFSFNGSWTGIADVDGDRRLDVLEKVGSQPLRVRKNQVKLGDKVAAWSDSLEVGFDGKSFPYDPRQGMWVDLNGNSRVDYVIWQGGQIYSIENQSSSEQVKFSNPMARQVHPQLAKASQWADINGDGLSDLYYVRRFGNDNALYFSLNNGQGWVSEEVQSYPIMGRAIAGDPYLIDLIGDGIPELVFHQPRQGISIYQLKNGRFELAMQLAGRMMTSEDLLVDFSQISSIAFGDITGNSSTNVILEIQGQIYFIDFYMGRPIESPYLLAAFETSLGERVEFDYQSSTRSYVKNSNRNRLPITMQLVQNLRRQAPSLRLGQAFGTTVIEEKSYTFLDGYYDLLRNEFFGFSEVQQVSYYSENPTDGKVETDHYYTYQTDGLLKGKVFRSTTSDLKDNFVYRQQENEWRVNSFQGFHIPWLRKNRTFNYERDKTSKVVEKQFEMNFTDLGLPDFHLEHHIGRDRKIYRTLSTRYSNQTGKHWLANLIVSKTIGTIREGKLQPSFKKEFEYLSDTSHLAKIYRIDGGKRHIERNTIFDAFGNPVRVSYPLGSDVIMNYDAGFNLQVTEVRRDLDNNISLIEKYDYDFVVGKIDSHTDHNGHQSRFEWDDLARLVAYYPPSEEQASISFDYQWGNLTSPSAIVTKPFGQEPSITYYDGIMRQIGEQKPSRDGHVLENVNIYGRFDVKLASAFPITNESLQEPIKEKYLKKFRYDTLLRQIQIDLPESLKQGGFYQTYSDQLPKSISRGTTVNYFSAHAHVSFNFEGEARVTYVDDFTRTCAIEEINALPHELEDFSIGTAYGCDKGFHTNTNPAIARTEFQYNILDLISEIRTQDKDIRNYEYDAFARIARIHSQKLGDILFRYNEMDQVIEKSYRDLTSQPISSVFSNYDEIGRILELRTLLGSEGSIESHWNKADVNYQWVYDRISPNSPVEQHNLLGQPSSMRIGGDSKYYYSYDPQGGTSSEALRVGSKTFEMGYERDIQGRLSKVTYPNKSQIAYNYDHISGHAKELNGFIEVALSYDSHNLLQNVILPGGILENFEYHEVSLNLKNHTVDTKSIKAGYLYHSYDHQNRIVEMSQSGALGSYVQAFTYDLRGQLRSRSLESLTHQGQSIHEYTYRYSNYGDILNLGSNNVRYLEQESQWSSEKGVYQLGKFGRVVSTPDLLKIDWNGFGQIREMIDLDGVKKSIQYQPDNKRFRATVKNGEQLVEDIVYFNQYVVIDLKSDEETHFYYAGNRRVASERKGKLEYLFQDHLSSESYVINNDGSLKTAVMRLPYGKVEQEIGNVKDRVHGYTGSIYENFGDLDHLEARFFDSSLGRFLSPDSLFLEEPDHCLATPIECNIYSYARNNPLKYMDPTGYQSLDAGYYLKASIGNMAHYIEHQAKSAYYALTGTAKYIQGSTVVGGGGVLTIGAKIPDGSGKINLGLRVGYTNGLDTIVQGGYRLGNQGAELTAGISKGSPMVSSGLTQYSGVKSITAYGGNLSGQGGIAGKSSFEIAGLAKLDIFSSGNARIDVTPLKYSGGLETKVGGYLSLVPTNDANIDAANQDFGRSESHDWFSNIAPYSTRP